MWVQNSVLVSFNLFGSPGGKVIWFNKQVQVCLHVWWSCRDIHHGGGSCLYTGFLKEQSDFFLGGGNLLVLLKRRALVSSLCSTKTGSRREIRLQTTTNLPYLHRIIWTLVKIIAGPTVVQSLYSYVRKLHICVCSQTLSTLNHQILKSSFHVKTTALSFLSLHLNPLKKTCSVKVVFVW